MKSIRRSTRSGAGGGVRHSLHKLRKSERKSALEAARRCLADYLHSTLSLPYSHADLIVSNSPNSLSFLLSQFTFSPSTLPRSLLRFLCCHPFFDHRLFFLESIGLSPPPPPTPTPPFSLSLTTPYPSPLPSPTSASLGPNSVSSTPTTPPSSIPPPTTLPPASASSAIALVVLTLVPLLLPPAWLSLPSSSPAPSPSPSPSPSLPKLLKTMKPVSVAKKVLI